MSKGEFDKLVAGMEPEQAAAEITIVLKKLFSLLDEEKRVELVMDLFGDSSDDKVGSMVHL